MLPNRGRHVTRALQTSDASLHLIHDLHAKVQCTSADDAGHRPSAGATLLKVPSPTKLVRPNDAPLTLLTRLCSYDVPPVDDITIEDFETFAIDRLRVLAEIESAFARNRPYDELKKITLDQSKKYLVLNSSTAHTVDKEAERRKDHVGHFVLRLAFCRS